MSDEMGRNHVARGSKGPYNFIGWETVRSTCKMGGYDSPLHIISAQVSELGLTFASKCVEGKRSEIPAVQRLIGELDVQDCMVVADALNCQRETEEAIVRGKGDYLLY